MQGTRSSAHHRGAGTGAIPFPPASPSAHVSAPTVRGASSKYAGRSPLTSASYGGGGSSGAANTSVVDIADYQPDPTRKVYLTTQSKHNPLQKVVRAIRRGHSESARVEPKKTNDIKDAIYALGSHTDEFNDFLRKLPRGHEEAVRLVMHRMKSEGIRMNTETYNLILEKVCDLVGTLCYDVYEDFRRNTLPSFAQPNVQTFRSLFRACERNGHYERVFQYYSHMRAIAGLRADTAFYNTLIGFCALIEDESQAAFMVEEMRDLQIEPDVHTYNNLMNVFAEAPYEILLKTFEDMLKRKIKPNRRTYNSLMRACQRTSDYERAFQLFEELKRDGIVPDVVTYNLLFVLCRDRLDFVLGIGQHSNLRRSREQKEVGMKAVAELAMALFAEMEECNILPNTFSYNALLGVLGRCHDLRVFDVFQQMKEDRRSLTAPSPSEDLMLTWVSENAHNRALPKLQAPAPEAESEADISEARIGGRAVAANLDSYLTAMDAAKRLQLPERAYLLYDEMRERGLKIAKSVVVVMLDVCAARQDKAKAYGLLAEAKAAGLRLDIQLYNSLLNVLAEAGDAQIFDELKRLKVDKEGLGLKPNTESYNLAIKACLKMRDLEGAMGIYAELCDPQGPAVAGPNAVTFATLFDLCSLEKDAATATKLMAAIKASQIPVTIHTHCRYLNVFVAAADPRAVQLFEESKRSGPRPDLDTYNTMLRYYLAMKDPATVTLFEELKTNGVEPDIETFNIVLDYAALTSDHNRSLRLFEELKTRGLSPDVETFNSLIKCFAQSGSAMVHKIFEEMAESRIAPDHVTFSILMQHSAGCRSLQTALEHEIVRIDVGQNSSSGGNSPQRRAIGAGPSTPAAAGSSPQAGSSAAGGVSLPPINAKGSRRY